jgi:hypothetical protein
MIESNYKIDTGFTKKDNAFVNAEINYKDDFTNDKYFLNGVIEENKIHFNVEKNKKIINKIVFNKDAKDFSKKLLECSKDYDFVEDFNKKHLNNFCEEINLFLEKTNSSMISKGKIYEGYKSKMMGMAGIKKINENLR